MTLADAISQFLFHCRYEKNLNPKTLKAYATDLRQMSEFLARDHTAAGVEQIDRAVLREYIRHLHAMLAERSLKRKVATMKSLFHFLEREDAIPVSPFRKMDVRIREARRLPRTVPIDQITRLFKHVYAARDAAEEGTPEWLGLLRDLAVLEALFATGARIGEVCSLTADDVDLTRGRVRILGKGSRERIVQICHPQAIATLGRYQALTQHAGTAWFFSNRFGRRLSEQSVRAALRRHAAAAGLGLHVTPHMFRHSVATLLHEDGVDIRYIQQLLGHRSIATTQIYTEVGETSQRSMLIRHHPRRHVEV
jgi:integrase/recombinase XerD